MELAGKVALVTGGGVRLGRALALGLAGQGCHVLVHCHGSLGGAREVVDEARALGVKADLHEADLARPEAAPALVVAAWRRFGALHLLVNSAALFLEADVFAEAGADLFDRLVAVNLRAPFLLSQAFAARLAPYDQGAVLNLVDARVRRAGTDHPIYRLTKRALWGLTEDLALELAPRVRVNALALGAILPPPGRDAAWLDEEARRAVPLRRAGGTGPVVEAALALLRNDFVTGAVVPVDGGQFL